MVTRIKDQSGDLLRIHLEAEARKVYTRDMKQVELLTGESLFELLSPEKKGHEIAEALGISEGAVSIWRKRLGIIPDHKGRPRETE